MIAVCRKQRSNGSGLKMAVVFLCMLSASLALAAEEKTFTALNIVKSPDSSEGNEEAHVDDDLDVEDLEVFHPTDQWQSLRPDQAVPIGSHVRLNLQTGKREAKLDEEETLKYWRKDQRQGIVNTQAQSLTAQELKKALKKLKNDGVELLDKGQEKGEAAVMSEYRSMEELKKDMAQLDMLVETDFQIMSRLLAQFNHSGATVEERVNALMDLEYLVHQVDNAQDLVSMGGVKLLTDALNSTDPRLQESAAFVLGSAISSNPRVQVEAVEGGALQKLLTLLATERPMSVKKKVLFAVCSLLRNFPFAQSHFLKLGGVQALGDLFRASGAVALRVRVVTLLYDMILEKELVFQVGLDSAPDSHLDRKTQYAQVSLLPLLVDQGWCGLVPELLASPEHDWREKALRTLLAMMPHCRAVYQQDSNLAHTLLYLRQQYQELVISERGIEEDDGYFEEILDLLDAMLLKVR